MPLPASASADHARIHNFFRGGPFFNVLFLFFFSLLGESGSKYNYKWAITGPSTKRHLNGVSLAG